MESSDLTIHHTALWEFPWHNGLSLHTGKMAKIFSEWLGQQNLTDTESDKENEISQLNHIDPCPLFQMAQILDDFSIDRHLRRDVWHRKSVREYLESPRAEICNPKKWKSYSSQDIAVATQIILRYQFLEQLVDAIGFPENTSRTQYEVQDISGLEIPPKLMQIVSSLSNWSSTITKLQNILTAEEVGTSLLDVNIAGNEDVAPLLRAFGHARKSHYQTVLLNMEFMSFCVRWLKYEYACFPDSSQRFGEELEKQSNLAGRQLLHQIKKHFTSEEGKYLYNALIHSFYTAVCISPLALLQDRQFGSLSIGKHHFITLAHHIGNVKPPHLRQMEGSFLRAIQRVANGSTAKAELKSFLIECQAFQVEKINPKNDWFRSAVMGAAHTNSSQEKAIPSLPPPPTVISSVTAISDEMSPQPHAAGPQPSANPEIPDVNMTSSGEETSDDEADSGDELDDDISSQDESSLEHKHYDSEPSLSPNPPSLQHQCHETDSETSSCTTSNSNSRSASPPPITYDSQTNMWSHIPSSNQEEPYSKTSSPGSSTSTDSEPASPHKFANELAAALESVGSSATPMDLKAQDLPRDQGNSIRARKSDSAEAGGYQQQLGTPHHRTSARVQKMKASTTKLHQRIQELVDEETETSADEDVTNDNDSNGEKELHSPHKQREDDAAIQIDAHFPTPGHLKKYALEGRLTGKVHTRHVLMDEDAPAFSDPYTLSVFGLEPNCEKETLHFMTHVNVEKEEKAALQNVHGLVERSYVNESCPRHHLPSARQQNYIADASTFFIINYDDYLKLTAKDIHDVFINRHILILDVPGMHHSWERPTLAKLGALTQCRDIEVGMYRGDNDVPNMLKTGTLDDIFKSSENVDMPRVLNTLKLPLGSTHVPLPPRYEDVASDQLAWVQTIDRPGFKSHMPPIQHLVWGTVATSGATSWVNLVDEGFGISFAPLCGANYFVVFRRNRLLPEQVKDGDLGSTMARPVHWDEHVFGNVYEAEAIVLKPGMALLMRPNTPHYVWTVSPSVIIGTHFLCSASILDTCHEIVHSCIYGHAITNQIHYDTRTLLRCLLTVWVLHYVDGPELSGLQDSPHIPNVSTQEGLNAITAVGNLIEFAVALDHRTYNPQLAEIDDVDEIEAATSRFRLFIRWFTNHFCIFINNQWVCATYYFKRRLVDFAATLMRYKIEAEGILPSQHRISQFTPSRFQFALQQHIQQGWPSILNYFEHAVTNADYRLYYTGPAITIKKRTPQLLLNLHLLNMTEQVELSSHKIYGDFGKAVSTASTNTKAYKRARDRPTDPSMRLSPDNMKRARRMGN